MAVMTNLMYKHTRRFNTTACYCMCMLLLLQLCVVSEAWSNNNNNKPSSNTGVHRRGFLESASLIAVGTVTAATLPAAEAQAAASTVYMPAPQDVKDKVVLISGANTGLGLETAKRLAAAGAQVLVTARSASKGEAAVREIQEYVTQQQPNSDVAANSYGRVASALVLDLCDLSQVKEFPKQVQAALGGRKIDVLMNNAGVMAIPDREITKDGFERTFQTNHLGHFALTKELIPFLKDDARIVNVSSEAYLFASKGLELDNLNGEREYGPWSSYGQSKLANILFTKELQKRSDQGGKSYTVLTLHPGAVATDLGRNIVGAEKWDRMKKEGMTWQEKLLFVPLSKFTKTVEDGASTQIFAAADPAVTTNKGAFLEDCKVMPVRPYAEDMDMARKLWEVSEEMSGETFKF